MKKFFIIVLLAVTTAFATWSCRQRTSTDVSATLDEGYPLSGEQCRTEANSPNDPPGVSYGPSCQDLVKAFPSIIDRKNREDKRVLCPMLRMVNRSKRIADNIKANLAIPAFSSLGLPVTLKDLIGAVREFGCNAPDCGAVAVATSAGQLKKKPQDINPATDVVDISRLDTALGVAHDCGFTFSFNETQVSDKTRKNTLKMLEQRAREKNGQLSWTDIMETKQAMCKRDFELAAAQGLPTRNAKTADGQSLEPSKGDMVEVNLIYTYLGGVDNGYILYSDVVRFFNAEMPLNKTKFLIGQALFDHLLAIGIAPDVAIVPRAP